MTATRRLLTSRGPLLALLLAPLLAATSCGDDRGDGRGSATVTTLEFPPDLPFDPSGWTTVTEYPRLGDPRAVRVPGSMFTHVQRAFPTTLRTDGPNANTVEGATMEGLLFEPLVQLHPENDEYIPGLASHWKIETHEDRTQTFTFHIDERARWSNGKPVQADDVYVSWWHRAQEDRQSPSNVMTFAEGYHEPKILDRRTIQVRTKEANWRLFLYFATMAIFPAAELRIPGDRYLEEFNWKYPTGSGPYVLEEVKKGESITFRRRSDWWAENEPWGKHTYSFDRIRFLVIRDTELQYEKFKKGELDWFQVGRAQRWVEDIPREPLVQKGWIQRRKVWNRRVNGFDGLAFNQRKPPFDDRRVRLAFAHLFNRERLMEKLFFNEYEYTNSTYPGSDWGSGDQRPRITFDPVRAEELLAEAGYKTRDGEGFLVGPDGKRLEVTLEYQLQEWERIWLVVQKDYEAAGVKFNLKLIDPSTLLQKIDERQFTIHFQAWGSIPFPNPETSWRSDLADKKSNNNITGFKSDRVDELCKLYNVTMERAAQKTIIREIDTIVCNEHPYAFAWHARSSRLMYWDKFGHPDAYLTKTEQWPERSMMMMWWIDEARQRALEQARSKDQPLPVGELDVKPWG